MNIYRYYQVLYSLCSSFNKLYKTILKIFGHIYHILINVNILIDTYSQTLIFSYVLPYIVLRNGTNLSLLFYSVLKEEVKERDIKG